MNRIIVIAGPTAVGKTEYAIETAKALNGEIVSADSVQLYKYMNIGSAKPSEEELSEITHHLVDIIDPGERFTVANYQKTAKDAINDIIERGKIPVISGGTGLYINSLIYDMDFAGGDVDLKLRDELTKLAEEKGGVYLHSILKDLDSDAALRIHPNNTKKLIRAIESVKLSGKKVEEFDRSKVPVSDYEVTMIGLIRDREELYERINKRAEILFEMGLVDEVKSLMDMGYDTSLSSMNAIGYKEVVSYINGEISLDESIELVKKNSRHYAKRQLTWIKGYDNIKLFNLSSYISKEDALEEIVSWLKNEM